MSWEENWLHLRYRYLNHQLRDFELQVPDPEELLPPTEQDILADLTSRTTTHFLEFFSRRGLVKLGLQFGLVDELRKKGFRPRMRIVTSEPPHHMLRIYDKSEKPENLLLELAAHRETTVAAKNDMPAGTYHFLFVDWLLLQNPRLKFTASRPRLPGQEYPSLGLGLPIGEVLMLVTERLKLDGMLTFPNHFHNGVLYSRKMHFVNPVYQAQMRAVQRDLSTFSLAEQSWAVELGCVQHVDGSVYQWTGAEMMLPVHPKLAAYPHSSHYEKQLAENMERLKFKLDWERFERVYPPA